MVAVSNIFKMVAVSNIKKLLCHCKVFSLIFLKIFGTRKAEVLKIILKLLEDSNTVS